MLNSSRYTPNNAILAALTRVQDLLTERGLNYETNVFSQGEVADFAGFLDLGCTLNLNTDAIWTMRQLINADILLMSKSSFCYTAALINSGIKIYEPWVNGPLSDWVVRKSNGEFDVAKFGCQINALLCQFVAESSLRPSAVLKPLQEVVESDKSVVNPCRAHDSTGRARFGNPNSVSLQPPNRGVAFDTQRLERRGMDAG